MKINGSSNGIPHEGGDPEMEALTAQLRAAFEGLGQAVQTAVSAPMATRPTPAKDHYAAKKAQAGVQASASSVAPRTREGQGVPVHQMLASRGFLGSIASSDDQLFAWDSKADTSLDKVSTRKLLGYYDDSMTALHSSLGRMDFDRKEGLWYERYREDLWREIDSDGDYYRAQSNYADRQYYDSYEADRMIADMQFQTQSYYDYDDQYR